MVRGVGIYFVSLLIYLTSAHWVGRKYQFKIIILIYINFCCFGIGYK